MNTRQREIQQPVRMLEGADPGASGDLDAARQTAEGLARAGQDAIDRALSGDSEAFLRDTRQQGGQ